MTSELIALIANIALALSFIVGLVFGIAQVRAAARDRRERLTLETISHFQTREFAELIHYMAYSNFPTTGKGMRDLPKTEQLLLIQFAQHMESLGLLVAQKLINIDLIDKTLGSLVTNSWNKYKPVFMDIRENQPDPFLGEYFQWLAEYIEKRMIENPRQPFHLNEAPSS